MKPILFSTPMVQAILDGNKTMTRRVVKPQPQFSLIKMTAGYHEGEWHEWKPIEKRDPVTDEQWGAQYLCPYKVEDILWVRETWMPVSAWSGSYKGSEIIYKSDNETITFDDIIALPTNKITWRPSIFMPREAARIFLRVIDIKAERVQDITELDAKSEGIKSYWTEPHRNDAPFIGAAKELGADLCHTRQEAFQQLWDSLNAKRGYSWDTNPWVWVISFERVPKE